MKRTKLLSLLVVVLLLLAACGGNAADDGDSGNDGGAGSDGAGEAVATEVMDAGTDEPGEDMEATPAEGGEDMEATPEGGADTEATPAGGDAGGDTGSTGMTDYSQIGDELVAAFAGEYDGTTVSVLHGLSGDEERLFESTFVPFEEATGIDVQLVPGGTVEAINVKVQSDTIEDIVNFPQPGGMAGYAAEGRIIDLNDVINPEWMTTNYNQGFIDTLTVEGPDGEPMLGGVFERINFKSAVWYPKAAFEEAGYEVPTTWEEQQELMDLIVADGDAPWCIGIESQGASGWPATDWMEDIMLRTTSLENYDAWATGELPFTSPEVRNALQILTDIWFNDDYVLGGRAAIASTAFGDAPTPMLQDPPQCWLHRQGNFITTFFETNVPGLEAGVDYDFYYLPPIDEEYGNPVLYAGDLFSMFSDRPEVRALMQYFTTYESIQPWIQQGSGALSPHQNSILDDYSSPLERRMAETILGASGVRFDASDLMPAEVGSGSFWKGITDYVSGSADMDEALETIQSGWENVGE